MQNYMAVSMHANVRPYRHMADTVVMMEYGTTVMIEWSEGLVQSTVLCLLIGPPGGIRSSSYTPWRFNHQAS